MDIMSLVDQLEDLLNSSRQFPPFTHSVLVNEDRLLEIIDQMRVAIPDEVKNAQRVLSERDRIMAQAQEERNRLLSIASEKKEQLLERDSLVQSAQARSDQITSHARAEADRLRSEADQYVVDKLTQLELDLDRILSQVRNGISTLKKDQPEP